MSLAYSQSLKEFGLHLISGEIGFIGAPAPNPNQMYEDFISFVESIAEKVRNKEYDNLDFDFYSNSQDKDVTFSVDYDKDWRLVFELYQKIKLNNQMCGTVCSTAVDLNVNAIYEFIGIQANKDDEYFHVLKELWTDFIATNPEQKNIDDKLKRIEHSFSISGQRFSELLNS